MFFEYHQNQVGNKYHCNDKVCSHILIEADSCHEANRFMEEVLCIVFDEDCGYESSECRWIRAYSFIEFPSYWDENLLFKEPESYCDYLHKRYKHISVKTTPHSRVFYKNGKIKEVGK